MPDVPWSYDASTVLDALDAPPTLEVLIERIGRFSRQSLLEVGTRMMWFMWKSRAAAEREPILRAMSPLLISLGAMFGGNNELPIVSEIEFRLLCNELDHSAEWPRFDSPFADAQLAFVRAAKRKLPASSRLSRLSDRDVAYAWREHRIGSIAQLQLVPFSYVPSDLVRGLLIYEEFKRQFDVEAISRLEKLERVFFGTSWENVLRIFGTLLILGDADPLGEYCPGMLHVPDSERPGLFGVDGGDLRILAARLGTKTTAYAQLGEELVGSRSVSFKYEPNTRRLTTHPIIICDDAPGGDFITLVPSPWHLRRGTSALLLDAFFAFANDHELPGPDVYSARGEAFGAQLRSTLAVNPAILDCDRAVGTKGKKPDFLWLGRDFGLVIEAKVRLRPNSDQLGEDCFSVFEGWRRSEEAIDQGAEFVARSCDGLAGDSLPPARWILLLVTLDPLAAELTGFRSAAKRWDWLGGGPFSALGIISPAALEHFALRGDADALANYVRVSWDALDPNALSRPPEGPPFEETLVCPPVRAAWERLFPDAPAPWRAPENA